MDEQKHYCTYPLRIHTLQLLRPDTPPPANNYGAGNRKLSPEAQNKPAYRKLVEELTNPTQLRTLPLPLEVISLITQFGPNIDIAIKAYEDTAAYVDPEIITEGLRKGLQ